MKGLRFIQIAIDGPAGAGKSTIAKILAEKLGYIYIDTGAMYRAITYFALKQDVCCEDGKALAKLAAQADIQLVRMQDGSQLVICNGVDVTEEIRSAPVNQKVSMVSSHQGLRAELVRKQQQMAKSRNVVMDGRDIGTVVLPEAQYKFFLTAQLEERARRRYRETLQKGLKESYSSIRLDLESRDYLDQRRSFGPLRPAADAIIFDTTQTSIDEVVRLILGTIKEGRE